MKLDIDNTEIYGQATALNIKRIRNIILTPKGSIPLLRDFGFDYGFIDLPVEQMKAFFISEIAGQVARYLPGRKVVNVTFYIKEIDKIVPKVVIGNE